MKRLFYIFTFLFVALSAMGDAPEKLFLKPNSNWKTDNARFAAYFFGNGDAWVSMTQISNTGGCYVVDVPTDKSYPNVIFCRMNPSTSENNWVNKWNQTEDLVIPTDGKDLYTVKDGTWDNGGGTWSQLKLMFFLPNSNWKVDNARFAAYFFGDGEKWVSMTQISNTGCYVVDVPTDKSYPNVIFCRMNPSTSENNWDNKWNQTEDLVIPTDGKDLYTVKDGTWDKGGGTWSNLTTDIANGLDAGVYYGTMTYTMKFTEGDEGYWHWISLPYDVNISDIKGANDAPLTYEENLVFKWYNTANRAGWPTEKAEPWEQLRETGKLEAGRGYILGVGESVSEITFKSAKKLHNVIDKVEGSNTEHKSTDPINSNWHLIGTGVYGNVGSFEYVNYVAVPKDRENGYNYYYLSTKPGDDNPLSKFEPSLLSSIGNLGKYKAFFVQHHGDYSFTKASTKSINAAPRRAQAEEVVDRYYVNIAGAMDSSYTAIFLAEDGSDEYVVGQDFLHFGASGASLQLYTIQGEDPMAFNYLQRADQKVVLGGYVAEAGRYTISIAMNGKPASVVLTDSVTGAVVDLLQQNYEFDAERGKLDGRFGVTITYAPAEEGDDDTTTDLENGAMTNLMVVRTNGGVIVEGLTVGAGVVIYDVAGRCVNEFVATETATAVALEKGIYLMSHNGETVKFVVNR